jgi:hypothetical protein
MNIIIDTNLQGTLDRLALERGISAELYVQNYIASHLTSQQREYVLAKVRDNAPDALIQLEAVIDAKRTEIKESSEAVK